jgi:hypothetical protein
MDFRSFRKPLTHGRTIDRSFAVGVLKGFASLRIIIIIRSINTTTKSLVISSSEDKSRLLLLS